MSAARSKIALASSSDALAQNPFASLELPGLADADPNDPAATEFSAKSGESNQAEWPWRGEILLRRETSHRNGKAVIILYQIPGHLLGEELEELARLAKIRCGCGGTLREREIELQGDHPDRIREFLTGLGFRVRGLS